MRPLTVVVVVSQRAAVGSSAPGPCGDRGPDGGGPGGGALPQHRDRAGRAGRVGQLQCVARPTARTRDRRPPRCCSECDADRSVRGAWAWGLSRCSNEAGPGHPSERQQHRLGGGGAGAGGAAPEAAARQVRRRAAAPARRRRRQLAAPCRELRRCKGRAQCVTLSTSGSRTDAASPASAPGGPRCR
eukprot:scaffold1531_cov296-Prasinococcus_capsulatus_cf.AAC.8